MHLSLHSLWYRRYNIRLLLLTYILQLLHLLSGGLAFIFLIGFLACILHQNVRKSVMSGFDPVSTSYRVFLYIYERGVFYIYYMS